MSKERKSPEGFFYNPQLDMSIFSPSLMGALLQLLKSKIFKYSELKLQLKLELSLEDIAVVPDAKPDVSISLYDIKNKKIILGLKSNKYVFSEYSDNIFKVHEFLSSLLDIEITKLDLEKTLNNSQAHGMSELLYSMQKEVIVILNSPFQKYSDMLRDQDPETYAKKLRKFKRTEEKDLSGLEEYNGQLSELSKKLLQKNRGIIYGYFHKDLNSYELIANNMKQDYENGVRAHFVEVSRIALPAFLRFNKNGNLEELQKNIKLFTKGSFVDDANSQGQMKIFKAAFDAKIALYPVDELFFGSDMKKRDIRSNEVIVRNIESFVAALIAKNKDVKYSFFCGLSHCLLSSPNFLNIAAIGLIPDRIKPIEQNILYKELSHEDNLLDNLFKRVDLFVSSSIGKEVETKQETFVDRYKLSKESLKRSAS